jgi:hypothetical protein
MLLLASRSLPRAVAPRSLGARRFLAAGGGGSEKNDGDKLYSKTQVNSMVGHNFPDFIEWWDRNSFWKVGYGLSAVTALSAVGPIIMMGSSQPVTFVPAVVLGVLTAGYWRVGIMDIRQTSHAVRRNYPVLGNFRYILETVRIL